VDHEEELRHLRSGFGVSGARAPHGSPAANTAPRSVPKPATASNYPLAILMGVMFTWEAKNQRARASIAVLLHVAAAPSGKEEGATSGPIACL